MPRLTVRLPYRIALVISRRTPFVMAALLAIIVAAPRTLSAQQLDVIRGQVTNAEQEPIENANITATSVSGGVNRTARSDRGGRFTITFPGGDGDYFVTVTSIGYAPRRFEVRRTADQEILVADVELSRMVMLDTMRAVAERERVNRNERTPDISGTEQSASSAAVSADQQGDLNAIAATIPGVTPIIGAEGDPAGFSVLGLSADQNSMTLNGANLGSSTLPRDAQVSTSARDHAVRREPRWVQRRAAQRSQRQRIQLHPPQQQPQLRCAAVAVDRPGRALTRPAVHQPVARRVDVRSHRLRQGVLQPLVPARPAGQRSRHPAEHRCLRVRGDWRVGGFRRAAARHRRGAEHPAHRRRPVTQQPAQRSGLAVRQLRPHAAQLHERHHLQARGERQLEPPDADVEPHDRAPRAQRRPHQLGRRRAAAAHVVLQADPAERDHRSASAATATTALRTRCSPTAPCS